MEMFTKFYGVDWLLFVLVVVHLWKLGQRRRSGFLFGIAAASTGFVLGLIINSAGTIVMNVVFVFMHLRAYLKWKDIDENLVAESIEQVILCHGENPKGNEQ